MNAADPIPYFPNEPISSFAGDFPFRSLLGQTLLFATTLCGGKRTVEKRKASSWQQLLCGKASLSVQLWQFSRNLGSQGTWVRGTLGRGTHKPRISVVTFYTFHLYPHNYPSPPPKLSTQTFIISTNGWWVEGHFLPLRFGTGSSLHTITTLKTRSNKLNAMGSNYLKREAAAGTCLDTRQLQALGFSC